MGLWGSKQQTKEFTTTNPTKPVDSSEIYITQSALDSVLNTADNSSSAGKPLPQKSSDKEANVDSDKRVKEYEEKMLRNLNVSTRNVEDLFNDRYVDLFENSSSSFGGLVIFIKKCNHRSLTIITLNPNTK